MTDRASTIIGNSERTQELLRNIRRVAPGPWPVLVLGETGTGKEMVARALHGSSQGGPFVPIDCSSLVGPLMESELFGHAKGAFTGAANAKIGLIEMADGGTAFFDEIGEMPLDLQSKLLRVLQEKEFRPVGATRWKTSRFRVVAATNRDLAREVERGNFRRDLFYRLNVVTLKLAPLRDRVEDIRCLVQHFLERHGRGHRISDPVMAALESYPWPGNVRELENCIQQMVAVNTGPLLHSADLPSSLQNHIRTANVPADPTAAFRSQPLAMAAAASAGPPSSAARMPVRREEALARPPVLPLVEVERQAILNALDYTQGDRGVAAMMLGIGRTTLYRKLKEYRIEAFAG